MTVELSLQTDEQGHVVPAVQGQALAEPTLLASLPSLKALQADPFTQGRALTAALGGDDLLRRLDADRLLLLACDEEAGAFPWEYAALDGSQLLACSGPSAADRIRQHASPDCLRAGRPG